MLSKWLGFVSDDDESSSSDDVTEEIGSNNEVIGDIDDLTSISAKLLEAESTSAKYKNELLSARELLKLSDSECGELRNLLASKEEKIQNLSDELTKITEIAELRQVLIDQLQSGSYDKLQCELDEAWKLLLLTKEALGDSYSKEQMGSVIGNVDVLKSSLSEVTFTLSQCMEEKHEFESRLSILEMQLADKEAQLLTYSDRLSKEEDFKTNSHAQASHAPVPLNSSSNASELEAKIHDLQSDLTLQTRVNKMLNSEQSTYMSEKASLEAQLAATNALLDQRTQDYETMKGVIVDTEKHLKELAEMLQDYESMKSLMSSTEKELEETKGLVQVLLQARTDGKGDSQSQGRSPPSQSKNKDWKRFETEMKTEIACLRKELSETKKELETARSTADATATSGLGQHRLLHQHDYSLLTTDFHEGVGKAKEKALDGRKESCSPNKSQNREPVQHEGYSQELEREQELGMNLQRELDAATESLSAYQDDCKRLTAMKVKLEEELTGLRVTEQDMTHENSRLRTQLLQIKQENRELREALIQCRLPARVTPTEAGREGLDATERDADAGAHIHADKYKDDDELGPSGSVSDELMRLRRSLEEAESRSAILQQRLLVQDSSPEVFLQEHLEQETMRAEQHVRLHATIEALTVTSKLLEEEGSKNADLRRELESMHEKLRAKEIEAAKLLDWNQTLDEAKGEFVDKLRTAKAAEAAAIEELAILRDHTRADSAALRAVSLEAEARCTALEQQLNDVKSMMSEARPGDSLYSSLIAETKGQLTELTMRYTELELKLLSATQKITELTTSSNLLTAHNKQISKELMDTKKRLSENNQMVRFAEEQARQLADSETRCKSLEDKMEYLKGSLGNFDGESHPDDPYQDIKKLRSENEALRSEVAEAKQRYVEDTKKSRKTSKEADKLTKELEDECALLRAQVDQIPGLNVRMEEADAKIVVLEARAQLAEKDLMDLRNGLKAGKKTSSKEREALLWKQTIEIKQLQDRCTVLEECTKDAQQRLGQSEGRCNDLHEQLMRERLSKILPGDLAFTQSPKSPERQSGTTPSTRQRDASALSGVCDRCKSIIEHVLSGRDTEITECISREEEWKGRLENLKQQFRTEKRAFVEKIDNLEKTLVEKEKMEQEYLHLQSRMTSVKSEWQELQSKSDKCVRDDTGVKSSKSIMSSPTTPNRIDPFAARRMDSEQQSRLLAVEAEVESLRAELRQKDQQILTVNRQNNELINALGLHYDINNDDQSSTAMSISTKKSSRALEKRNTELQAKCLTIDSVLKSAKLELLGKEELINELLAEKASLLEELQDLKQHPPSRSQALVTSLGLCNNVGHKQLEKRVEELSVKLREAHQTEERLEEKIKKLAGQKLERLTY